MDREASVVTFGPFEFDFEESVLRRDGDPVPLQPQPTAVLAALLEVPGRIVSRAELQDAVWRYTSPALEGGLNFNVRQVRRALGDDADAPEYVETVYRRGYRFIKPVDSARTPPFLAARRRWMVVPAVAGVILARTWLGLGAGLGAGAGELRGATLDGQARTTFDAAEWLLGRREYERSLARLDSVRVAVPTYGPAWTLTARARLGLGDPAGARAAADRAIELDEASAEGWYLKGLALLRESRGGSALQALEEAVELDPSNPRYRQWLAQALANALRFDEAIDELEEARRIDPVANLVGVDLAQVYLAASRYDDARAFCEASLELAPSGESWARDCLMSAHHFVGDAALALEQARALMLLDGSTDADAAAIHTLADYFAWDLARMEAVGSHATSFGRVRARARLGDRAGTLAGLRELRRTRDSALQWAPRDVWFRFLHGDPDFEAILREAGLPTPTV